MKQLVFIAALFVRCILTASAQEDLSELRSSLNQQAASPLADLELDNISWQSWEDHPKKLCCGAPSTEKSRPVLLAFASLKAIDHRLRVLNCGYTLVVDSTTYYCSPRACSFDFNCPEGRISTVARFDQTKKAYMVFVEFLGGPCKDAPCADIEISCVGSGKCIYDVVGEKEERCVGY